MGKKVRKSAKLPKKDTKLVHTSTETEIQTAMNQDSQPQNDTDDEPENEEPFKSFIQEYLPFLNTRVEASCNLPNVTHLNDSSGVLLTVLGARCIVTYVNLAPILVTFDGAVIGKERVLKCRVIWYEKTNARVLDEVENNTKVQFDAVLQNGRFCALLVWTGEQKPSHQILPDSTTQFCRSMHTGTASIFDVMDNHATLKAQTEGENLVVKVHKNDFFMNGKAAGAQLVGLPRLDPTLGIQVQLYQMMEGNDEECVSWMCSAAWIGQESPYMRKILLGNLYSVCSIPEVMRRDYKPTCIFFDLDAYFHLTNNYFILKVKVEDKIEVLSYVGDFQKDLRFSHLTSAEKENVKITILRDPNGSDGVNWSVLSMKALLTNNNFRYHLTDMQDLELRNVCVVNCMKHGNLPSPQQLLVLNTAEQKKRQAKAKYSKQLMEPVKEANPKGHAPRIDITREVVCDNLPNDTTGELVKSLKSAETFKYTLLKGDLNPNADNSLSFVYTEKKRVKIICLSADTILDYDKWAEPRWPCSLMLQHRKASLSQKPVLTPILGWRETNFNEVQILLNQKVVSYDKNTKVLRLKNNDGNDTSVKEYALLANNVYTDTSLWPISRFTRQYHTALVHAVLTDIPTTWRGQKQLTKQVVFLSCSVLLALVSRTAFIYSKHLIPSTVKLKKNEESNSGWPSSKVIKEIFDEKFKSIVISREIVSKCPMGNNRFIYPMNFKDTSSLQVSQAQLVHVTDDYAIFSRSRKNRYIICLKSDLFHQGQRFNSKWDLLQNSKKNYTVIESMTSELMVGTHKVDRLGEIGWLNGGPPLLFIHTCSSHNPSILPCGEEFSTSNALLPCPPPLYPIRHRQLGVKFNYEVSDAVTSSQLSEEFAALICKDGKTFTVADFRKFDEGGTYLAYGRILYFHAGILVLFEERSQTKFWCNFRNVFINGRRLWHTSQLVEFMLKRKVLTILAYRAEPVKLLFDIIDNYVVICFDFLQDETELCIHCCDNHTPSLLTKKDNYVEEVMEKNAYLFLFYNCIDDAVRAQYLMNVFGREAFDTERKQSLTRETLKHFGIKECDIDIAGFIEEFESSLREENAVVEISEKTQTCKAGCGQEGQEHTVSSKLRKIDFSFDNIYEQPREKDLQSESEILLEGSEEKSNKPKVDVKEIIVRAKNINENIMDMGTCLVSDFNIAIVQVKDTKICLYKEDILFNDFPVPETYNLRYVLSSGKKVRVHYCEMQCPVYVYDHLVTHIGIFAYFGNTPTKTEEMLQEWREKPVRTLHCEYDELKFTDEEENSIVSTDVMGNIVKVTNCNAILKFKDVDNPEIYSTATCKKADIFIDRHPVLEEDNLKQLLKPLVEIEWMATVRRRSPSFKDDDPKYEASIMWIGGPPSIKDTCQSSDSPINDKGNENSSAKSDSAKCDSTQLTLCDISPALSNKGNCKITNNNFNDITNMNLLETLVDLAGLPFKNFDILDKLRTIEVEITLKVQSSLPKKSTKKKHKGNKESTDKITEIDYIENEKTPSKQKAKDKFKGSDTQNGKDETPTTCDVGGKKKKKKKKKKGVKVLGNDENSCGNDKDHQNLNEMKESQSKMGWHTMTNGDTNMSPGCRGKAKKKKEAKPAKKKKKGHEKSDNSFPNETECEDSNDCHSDSNETYDIPGTETMERKSTEENVDDSSNFCHDISESRDDAVSNTEFSKTEGREWESEVSVVNGTKKDELVTTSNNILNGISFAGSQVYEKVTSIPDFDENEVISFTNGLRSDESSVTPNYKANTPNKNFKYITRSFWSKKANMCTIPASKNLSNKVEGVSHHIDTEEASGNISTEEVESGPKKSSLPQQFNSPTVQKTTPPENRQVTYVAPHSLPTSPSYQYHMKATVQPTRNSYSPQHSTSTVNQSMITFSPPPPSPSSATQFYNNQHMKTRLSHPHPMLSQQSAPSYYPNTPIPQPTMFLISKSYPGSPPPYHSTVMPPSQMGHFPRYPQLYNKQHKRTLQSPSHPMLSQESAPSYYPNTTMSHIPTSYPGPPPPYHSTTVPLQMKQFPRPHFPPSTSVPYPGPQHHIPPHYYFPQQNMQHLPSMQHFTTKYMPDDNAQRSLKAPVSSVQESSVPSDAATDRKNKEVAEEDEIINAEDTKKQGVVIDIHRTTGQLRAQHGKTFFFSRNQCLFMGVSLKQVELWHVLTLGLEVEYTTSPTGIKTVCVGQASGHKASELQSQLQDWCRNNHVPQETTETLLQLAAASK
ncbi:hypothetical protein Pcinc_018127 [Petrolisthes cinctipes]|uniref:Uncharacterized protein n=1 Tax=Petrolisthes cinctipes TaxID=88211 RepID=A0AAE1FNN0_PETCI|nr:hypothetical protein Pcinc_018127 [Petrolisthes cinctipes]